MLRIAYGVQGTGNGHITRARIMADAFSARDDVEVDFFFSGRDPDAYFDMACFGDYRTFTGLTFSTHHGKIDRWKTVRNVRLLELITEIKRLDLSQYDLVLNDFEPITAWAARKHRIPSISLSHQAAFLQGAPLKDAGLLDRLLMRYFAPADIKLGVHWFHFGQNILPPFINEKPAQDVHEKNTLVYLPFESIEDIQFMLEPLGERSFVCFHPLIKATKTIANITWYPTSFRAFKIHLQQCNGVIANAGFELSSECLQLGKKLLLKPLQGQFEQQSNAQTLMLLDLCQVMHRLDTDMVEEWLDTSAAASVLFPDSPQLLIDWLISKNWNNPEYVCEQLWKTVKYPDKTRQKLMKLAF